MKYYHTIKISGPGGCLWSELVTIKTALQSEGFNVEIEDDFPDPREPTMDDVRKLMSKVTEKNIKIVLEHQPWGG